MDRFSKRLCAVLVLCSAAFIAANSAESGTVKQFSWAIGYDEGLSAKLFVTDKIATQLSIGYNVLGADTLWKVPNNQALLKVGGAYLLKGFDRLRVNAFLDGVLIMNQDQLQYTNPVYNKRYNRWDVAGRIGLAPELFLTDHFSVSYKFGLQYIYYGTRYKLNANQTDTESSKTDHSEIGVYGAAGGPFQLLQNLGVMVYF
jgi:hypothetical protein